MHMVPVATSWAFSVKLSRSRPILVSERFCDKATILNLWVYPKEAARRFIRDRLGKKVVLKR